MTSAQISQHISQVTGRPFENTRQRSVGGGCINTTFVMEDGERQFFVKTNQASLLDMFAAEFDGLNEIRQTNTIKVPNPVCFGEHGATAYLVMEYLPINGGGGRNSIEMLAHNLAAMHSVTNPQYGWYRDNTIGSTPQINCQMGNWINFWRDQRLGFQLKLAGQKGYGDCLLQKGEQLMGKLEDFFPREQPPAALMHGDLWSGNYSFDGNGEPVIFDPAVYYGDREADIAMTELFGGFPASFYTAYNDVNPLAPEYKTRKVLYNLYHILNHFNMFGGGYGSQAERMIEQLLSEV